MCAGKPGMLSVPPLTWSERLKVAKGIATGLVYLHEFSPKKYVHGDLKPSNILMEQDMEPKISDFGLARLANIAGGSSSPTVQSNRIIQTEERQQQHTITRAYLRSSLLTLPLALTIRHLRLSRRSNRLRSGMCTLMESFCWS